MPLILSMEFIIQNFILYLVWTAFIPQTLPDGIEDKVFISETQSTVFLSYMVLYTVITLLPQILFCTFFVKTRPSLGRVSQFIAKATLIVLSVCSLHQFALILTGLGRAFQRVDKKQVKGSKIARSVLQALFFITFVTMLLVVDTNGDLWRILAIVLACLQPCFNIFFTLMANS